MESNLSTLSIPLSRAGQNLAPAQPIVDWRQNKKPPKTLSKFHDAIKKKYEEYLKYESQVWNEIITRAQLVALFRRGDQINIQRRPFGAPGYYVRPAQNDNAYRQTAMNLMSFHSQACEAKVIASNPNVNMRPGDDTPEAIAAAQACRPVVDCYETEWYTGRFTRREAIRLLNDGIVIHQVRWNPFKGDYQVSERTVTRRDEVMEPGGGYCADCQYEGELEEFQPTGMGYQCPQCGSEAVDAKEPVTQSMAQIGMGPAKPTGEPELITSPMACWRWDLASDLECSSWAIKRQRISQGAVSLMIGDAPLPDSASSDDHGLDVIHNLAYAGQAFQGQSWSQYNARDTDKRPTMAEFWMSPEDYADIPIEGAVTVSGQQLPAGKMGQHFREPMCFVGLNDMSLIVGVYQGESHQDEVVTAHWFMDAESGAGRGMEDTAAVQKRFNAVDGQIYQGLATTATPSVFTDMRMIKEDQGQYLFRPGTNIDINLSMLPPNLRLQDAIYVGNPGQVSQQFVNYGNTFLMQMMTMSALSVDFSENVLPVDNRTATGAQITAQLANSLYGPMLISKGESRVEIAKKIVCLVAKHGMGSRFYIGKGATKGRMVDPKDLKHKIVFELVANSWLPVTPFSQQQDIQAAVTSLGGVEALLVLDQQKPAWLRQLLKPFNFSLEAEDADDVSTLCLQRLEQMKEALEAGVDDPTMLTEDYIQPPVSEYEPKHKEKGIWWSDYLDTVKGQEAPLVLRTAMEQMIILHQNLETQRQMPQAVNAGMVQAAGAAPMALGAAALQGQQEAAPEKDDSAKIEADMQMDDAKHKTDLTLKQMEGETQRDVASIQAQTQIETTKIAGDNQVRAAKAKPKPVARKSA